MFHGMLKFALDSLPKGRPDRKTVLGRPLDESQGPSRWHHSWPFGSCVWSGPSSSTSEQASVSAFSHGTTNVPANLCRRRHHHHHYEDHIYQFLGLLGIHPCGQGTAQVWTRPMTGLDWICPTRRQQNHSNVLLNLRKERKEGRNGKGREGCEAHMMRLQISDRGDFWA